MTQEEKQLLLKDLCARLPYGFKYQVIYDNRTPQSVKNIILDGDFTLFDGWLVHEIKPYLRPMSSMTKDETRKYHELCDFDDCDYTGREMYFITVEAIDYLTSIHVNYRNLIEKGLALKAPEGMYN